MKTIRIKGLIRCMVILLLCSVVPMFAEMSELKKAIFTWVGKNLILQSREFSSSSKSIPTGSLSKELLGVYDSFIDDESRNKVRATGLGKEYLYGVYIIDKEMQPYQRWSEDWVKIRMSGIGSLSDDVKQLLDKFGRFISDIAYYPRIDDIIESKGIYSFKQDSSGGKITKLFFDKIEKHPNLSYSQTTLKNQVKQALQARKMKLMQEKKEEPSVTTTPYFSKENTDKRIEEIKKIKTKDELIKKFNGFILDLKTHSKEVFPYIVPSPLLGFYSKGTPQEEKTAYFARAKDLGVDTKEFALDFKQALQDIYEAEK